MLRGLQISIHAPREGSDPEGCHWGQLYQISIHAPREGSDPGCLDRSGLQRVFQSTLPVRGATVARGLQKSLPRISIHAPREGSDLQRGQFFREELYFNPRSP